MKTPSKTAAVLVAAVLAMPQGALAQNMSFQATSVEARWWLLANEVQLKQDLALGAGPAVDDLAGLAGIAPERRAHFGRLLQKHRARLLTRRDISPQEAARVMSRVGELVLADPVLRADGEAVLAAL